VGDRRWHFQSNLEIEGPLAESATRQKIGHHRKFQSILHAVDSGYCCALPFTSLHKKHARYLIFKILPRKISSPTLSRQATRLTVFLYGSYSMTQESLEETNLIQKDFRQRLSRQSLLQFYSHIFTAASNQAPPQEQDLIFVVRPSSLHLYGLNRDLKRNKLHFKWFPQMIVPTSFYYNCILTHLQRLHIRPRHRSRIYSF
jgi:hypothetical protein